MSYKLARNISTFGYGSEAVRVGDLNGDGIDEILVVQCYRPTREISCMTVIDSNSNILWRFGEPSEENGEIFSDLPVQIYDWDGDGFNEVLYISHAIYAEALVWVYSQNAHVKMTLPAPEILRKNRDLALEQAVRYEGNAVLHVLDGRTGKEKTTIDLPAPADDCLAMADFTGHGYKRDFVVKDRYWNIWGVSCDGRVLWHHEGSTGHFPAVHDVDGDGFDEVFIGSALIDHDGQVLWRTKDYGGAHQDTACVMEYGGEIRFMSLDTELRCLDRQGGVIWTRPCGHGQHMVPGRYFQHDDRPGYAVVDIIDRADGETLILYDWDGNEIWRRLPGAEYKTCHMCGIDWTGNGLRSILLFSETPGLPALVYGADGNILDRLAPEVPPGAGPAVTGYSFADDLLGGGREQAVTVTRAYINIFQNTLPGQVYKKYNMTYYPG